MTPTEDDLGLSIDMLDADRLRDWARLLLVHGADISHWGSVPFVAGKLQILATNIESTVRDIGTLRQQAAVRAESAAHDTDRPTLLDHWGYAPNLPYVESYNHAVDVANANHQLAQRHAERIETLEQALNRVFTILRDLDCPFDVRVNMAHDVAREALSRRNCWCDQSFDVGAEGQHHQPKCLNARAALKGAHVP